MNRMNEGLSKIPPKVMMIIAGALLLVIIAVTALVSQLPSGDGQTAQESGATGQGGSEGATGSEGSGEDGVPPIPGGDSDVGNGADGSGGDDEDPGTASVRLGQGPPEPGVIAQVGEEYIYQDDLNYMIAFSRGDDNETELIDALIEDSIILQAAADEGLISLNDSVYGSESKDMRARIDLTREVRDIYNEEAIALEGEIITIWFNNMIPGPAGYEEGRNIAQEKISQAQNRVKTGELTMEQAAAILSADEEIEQADRAWRTNVYRTFSVSNDQQITIDQNLDAQIWELNQSEVSPVFVGSDEDQTGEARESFFVFVSITQKETGQIESFDSWVADNKTKYEVSIY